METLLVKTPTCGHWTDCGVQGIGRCDLNLKGFGTHPSLGKCNTCDENPAKGKMQIVRVTVAGKTPTPKEIAEAKAKRIARLRQAWNDIHIAALAGQLAAKIDGILNSLPCGTCQDHFKPLRTEPIPPDAAEQFPLSVGWHNVVNAELGKPLMTVADALKLYPHAATTAVTFDSSRSA